MFGGELLKGCVQIGWQRPCYCANGADRPVSDFLQNVLSLAELGFQAIVLPGQVGDELILYTELIVQ